MPSTENQFDQLALERFPKTKDKNLRAWNAADEYLLQYIQENQLRKSSRTLIVNDQFGALTCSLAELEPTVWTDSFLSKIAIKKNLEGNQLVNYSITFVNQTSRKLKQSNFFDLVIVRVPKHNSLLKYQLTSIGPHIDNKTKIIAAGMSKDIHKSTLKLFQDHLGSTTTSLAKKKARLIFSQIETERRFETIESINEYRLKEPVMVIKGMPGVFSRDSLDRGTRVLLNYLPDTHGNQKLIDLGCGTGVLGTAAAIQNPQLQLTFCDESWLATESAKLTFLSNCYHEKENPLKPEHAEFITTDSLMGFSDAQYDYVLCNPPFHQQNVQTLAIANQMFKQSANKLKPRGELRVVANRHLKYRPLLNSYFNQVSILSNDPKFIVWSAKNPKR